MSYGIHTLTAHDCDFSTYFQAYRTVIPYGGVLISYLRVYDLTILQHMPFHLAHTHTESRLFKHSCGEKKDNFHCNDNYYCGRKNVES